MKKTALFLLACIMLLFVGCSSDGTDWAPLHLAASDEASNTSVAAEQIAVAFSSTAPLGGMEITFSVTGEHPSATVSVYKAEKDYAATLSEKPVRQEALSDLTTKMMWQFRTLPAGNYLLVFSDLNDAALVRAVAPSQQASGKILNYQNGEISTDGTCLVTLFFIPTNDSAESELNTFTYPIPEE